MINRQLLFDKIRDDKKLDGIYVGKVKDINDPLKLNRVKVEIDELTKGIKKDWLPWYVIEYPVKNDFNNQSSIPPKDSYVLVKFPNNDIYNGVVYGMISRKPVALKG